LDAAEAELAESDDAREALCAEDRDEASATGHTVV